MSIRTRLLLIAGLTTAAFLIAIGIFIVMELYLGGLSDELIHLREHSEAIASVRVEGAELFMGNDLEESWIDLDEKISTLEVGYERSRSLVLIPRVSDETRSALETIEQLGRLTFLQYFEIEIGYNRLLATLQSTDFYSAGNFSLISIYDRPSYVHPELWVVIQLHVVNFRNDYALFDAFLADIQRAINSQTDFIDEELRILSRRVLLTSGLLCFILIATAISMSLMFARSVASDTANIAGTLTEMMEQQQPLDINVSRGDELGNLARRIEIVFSELLTTRDQLVEREKMAALGGLIAGVAHEINTPIGTGITASSFLQDRSAEIQKSYRNSEMTAPDMEKYLQTVQESSELILNNLNRAAALVRSFKQIAVDQNIDEKRLFNGRSYIESLLLSLRPTYKRRAVKVSLECPENLMMFCNPGAISQIVANLIQNTLVHGYAESGGGPILIKVEEQDDRRRIIYSDEGAGIDPANLRKIFEPFYTTKRGDAGGTGLGLHVVYNLVTRSLNGTILCNSAPGEGAEFIIDFPANLSGEPS